MTVAERRALPYMHPGRADVIDAGALILDRVLRRTRVVEPHRLRGRHPRRHRLVDGGGAVVTDLPAPGDRAAVPEPGAARARAGPDDPATADDARRAHRRPPYAGSPPPTTSPSSTRGSSVCRACPRLVRWREDVARDKRASFADQPYWGRPIAGWGAPTAGAGEARIVIVGLAPAANGGNRTGRVFTGDSSGDWLFASLHRVGPGHPASAASTPATARRWSATRMVATVRCAPPANKPTVAERDTCAPWINRELALLAPTLRVVVALGRFGWDGALRALAGAGFGVPDRSRGSATAPEVALACATSREVHAARLLPPLPAEHLHRPADDGDARRRARLGAGPRRRVTRGLSTVGASEEPATIASRRPRIPIGRGSRLKSGSVWVRPPAGAPGPEERSRARDRHLRHLPDPLHDLGYGSRAGKDIDQRWVRASQLG